VATGVHSRVVKWKGREADHSPLSNAEVKDGRRYTASLLYALMVWTGRTLPCYDNDTYRHAETTFVCTVRFIIFWFSSCHSSTDPSCFFLYFSLLPSSFWAQTIHIRNSVSPVSVSCKLQPYGSSSNFSVLYQVQTCGDVDA